MREVRNSTACLVPALCVAFFMPCTLIAGSPSDAKRAEVEKAFEKAFAAEDYAQMVTVGLELEKLLPNDPHLQYLLSLAYVSTDDADNAIKWLTKSAENGYRNIGPSKKWKKFDAIRSRSEFKKAQELIRETRRKGWEAFTEEAKRKEPLIILPPNYTGDEARPLLVVAHRYGGTPEEIAEVFRPAAARVGAILVAPRVMRKAAGGGYSWGDTFGWREQRESVFEAVFMLLDAAEKAVRKHPIDNDKFFVAGYSQGADVALWATQHQSNLIRGVLAIAPRDYELFERYRGSIRPFPPKFFLLVGSEDELLADSLQIEDQVRGANMPVKVKVLDKLGHALPKDPTDAIEEGLRYMLDRDGPIDLR